MILQIVVGMEFFRLTRALERYVENNNIKMKSVHHFSSSPDRRSMADVPSSSCELSFLRCRLSRIDPVLTYTDATRTSQALQRDRQTRFFRADTPSRSSHISIQVTRTTTTQHIAQHHLPSATLHSCFRSSHTFHHPSTQCLDHGGIFPPLITGVVIHPSWTTLPFHGLRRG